MNWGQIFITGCYVVSGILTLVNIYLLIFGYKVDITPRKSRKNEKLNKRHW